MFLEWFCLAVDDGCPIALSDHLAEVMEALNIPKGVRCVLFRTLNTDRKLMFKKEYDTSAVGFMEDGAKWLVDNTDIKLIGLDYLNVAASVDALPVHYAFLQGREGILIHLILD